MSFSFGPNGAYISQCGDYRYTLVRKSELSQSHPTIVWLMLNPSTADWSKDDPTIRKVIGFSERENYGKIIVVNLFAYRATDPKVVRDHLRHATRNVQGGRNEEAVKEAAQYGHALVCAWGTQPWAQPQARRVMGWLQDLSKPVYMYCLGRNKNGSPLHPLMPSYKHKLIPCEPGSF